MHQRLLEEILLYEHLRHNALEEIQTQPERIPFWKNIIKSIENGDVRLIWVNGFNKFPYDWLRDNKDCFKSIKVYQKSGFCTAVV